MGRWSHQLVVLVIAALVIAAPAAYADTLRLQISDGITTITIDDGGLGDLHGSAGIILFSGQVGVWDINVSTGAGSSVLGAGNMDLNTVNIAPNGTATTLTILFTQFGMTTPVSGFDMEFGGTSTNVSSVLYQAWADDGNNPFGLSQLIGQVGPLGSSPFAGTASGGVSVSGSYSLTQQVQITGTGIAPTGFSGDAELNATVPVGETVPEPATALLLGIGLVGIAVGSRRRARTHE